MSTDRKCMPRKEAVRCILSISLCMLSAGCSGNQLASKVIFGTVTCRGEKVEQGHGRFVPIDGTPGPASTAAIVDGEYRIEARGGVPIGKHRVEIVASKKTGRKVMGWNGNEQAMIDETVRLGPQEYEGEGSPLTLEVTAESDGHFDIEIPSDPGGPRPANG